MINKLLFCFLTVLTFDGYTQTHSIDKAKVREDLNEILNDLSNNYVYLEEKKVDLNCIQTHYGSQIEKLKTKDDVLLFFEYLLDEFYDSHLHLNRSTTSSYRLYSPIYASWQNGKALISSIWQTQVEICNQELLGGEILKLNGIDLDEWIEGFPTRCNDKSSYLVKEWIVNKILAGKYNEPRVVTIKLDKKTVDFDLNELKLKTEENLLSLRKIDDIAVIRINNSLGQNELLNQFDNALDSLLDTKGIVLDLRNTVDGGNSYLARGIMSRFISEPQPYQKHSFIENSSSNPEDHPKVERSWIEYVNPRGKTYNQPVVVLVGRWTGSMGEGLAIGFEGMQRGIVVGSKMERLAGEINGFSFLHQAYGYSISTAKLYHINGTPREKYIPTQHIEQSTQTKDEVLEKGIQLILDSQ